MKKVFLSGVGGMLGKAFYEYYSERCHVFATDKDKNEEWLVEHDFSDAESYRNLVLRENPDVLFHIGAQTSLEVSELNQRQTFLDNYFSAETAVSCANELDIPLVFISTAGIFDGAQNSYDDFSKGNALGVYGLTKQYAEEYILNFAKKAIIFRAGWMMGGGPQKDKKFVGKILRQIIGGNKTLHVVNDKFGTPTYTKDFVLTLDAVLSEGRWGLYNCVCEGGTSRIEVAQEILEILDLSERIKIVPVSSDYFSKEYHATRPESENLINYKLDMLGLNKMRPWKVALNEYLEDEWREFFM